MARTEITIVVKNRSAPRKKGKDVSSHCLAKQWDTRFSSDRGKKDVDRFMEVVRAGIDETIGGLDKDKNRSDLEIFFSNEKSECSVKAKELEHFTRGATLRDLELPMGNAGYRRAAWIDDRARRSSSDLAEMQVEDKWKTAAGLLRHLTGPRSGNDKRPDADRRLLFIRTIDPHFILALVYTVSTNQRSMLRDLIWKHIAFQTTIQVKIPRGFAMFRLEIHIPYFTLRTNSNHQDASPGHIHGAPPRRWTDLAFLAVPDSFLFQEPQSIVETHFAFVISGFDHYHWTAYCFDDSHFEEDEEEDEEEEDLDAPAIQYQEPEGDPISSGKRAASFPIWDPREYFLMMVKIRIELIFREWESVVRFIEICVRGYQERHPSALYQTPSQMNHKTKDDKRVFDWTQQTIQLLTQLIEILSQIIKAWATFKSENGDIGYFSDINPSSGQTHATMLLSLRSIQETFEKLERLRDTLQLLNSSCHVTAGTLHLRLTVEANEAVTRSGQFAAFTMSILSPIAIAISYYSIPKETVPLRFETKWFFPFFIFSIMATVQLLFMVARSFPNRLWWGGKGCRWVERMKAECKNYFRYWTRKRSDTEFRDAQGDYTMETLQRAQTNEMGV